MGNFFKIYYYFFNISLNNTKKFVISYFHPHSLPQPDTSVNFIVTPRIGRQGKWRNYSKMKERGTSLDDIICPEKWEISCFFLHSELITPPSTFLAKSNSKTQKKQSFV